MNSLYNALLCSLIPHSVWQSCFSSLLAATEWKGKKVRAAYYMKDSFPSSLFERCETEPPDSLVVTCLWSTLPRTPAGIDSTALLHHKRLIDMGGIYLFGREPHPAKMSPAKP